ncbi:MAG: aminotransferase class III-fold pyridoxal phosphate-dependent enzyme [Rhodospirillales bacterium]
MPDSSLTNSKIVAAYRQKTPGSAKLAEQARTLFPSGITHDTRKISPYGIYVERADGSHKWDIDGNEYVDYRGGHGALILGHNHPVVLKRTEEQLRLGSHYGAGHPLEVRWGQIIHEMIPSAEKIRFVASGSEANLMAVRLARAFTGKTKIVRFLSHFHGWHDHMAFGVSDHFDGSPTPGVLKEIASNVLLAPPDDIEATRRIIESDSDIAAVIIEPTGGGFGQSPLARDFLEELRAITQERDIVLIFDEVVTGFRVHKNGVQGLWNIIPDLTSLAKIAAGGMPGGAVCGRAEIMDHLDFAVMAEKGLDKIPHQGTFNANPVSAAAGISTLEIVRDTDVCERVNAAGEKMRAMLNGVFEEENVPWAAYGTFSVFFIYTNPDNLPITPSVFDPFSVDPMVLKKSSPFTNKLSLALLLNGVDTGGKPGGKFSIAHTEADLEHTAEAMRTAIRLLREDGDL